MMNNLMKRSIIGNRSSQQLSDLAAAQNKREYPTVAEEYELLDECGRGISAVVWRATCKPFNEVVAVKILDLETMNCSLEEIIREAQTMRQQNHPNVLALHSSFVHNSNLWMVMPYVSGGSVLNIMKYAYPEGLEEPVIATILREVLKGLDYMHKHGHIHRDVKAGNILIDANGQTLLADFGVAASMERSTSWGNTPAARNTFVGTPCWMAPEVMEQTRGYNELADIWSFGITILELAHGHAPFARFPPMKVLLMTIQNPPPILESDSGKKHFSKAMRDIVAKCLVKDPARRPTALQLLDHKFFKTAHEAPYLMKHLLQELPSVEERVRLMRTGRAPSGATRQDNDVRGELSQEAYVRGVSKWNFDVNTLKAAAASEAPEPLPPISESAGPGAPPAEAAVANGMPMATAPQPHLQFPVALSPPPGPHPGSSQAAAPPAAAAAATGLPVVAMRPPVPSEQGQQQAAGMPPTLDLSRSSLTSPMAVKPPLASPGHASLQARVPSFDRLPITPSKDVKGQSSGKGGASAIGKPAHKKQGRFEVYEGEPPPLSPPLHNGAALMEQHALPPTPDHARPGAEIAEPSAISRPSSISGDLGEAGGSGRALAETGTEKAEKAKRKGRFQIVEDDFIDPKKSVGRSASSSNMDVGRSGGVASPPPGLATLLPALRTMLEGAAGQYELMKELVAAVTDSERGRHSALATFLAESADKAERQKHGHAHAADDTAALRADVAHLREENQRLRDRLRLLEEEFRRQRHAENEPPLSCSSTPEPVG